MEDTFNVLTKVNLAVPLAVTASANRTGVDVQQYTGTGILLLTALNNSGTTPTLDVKIQDSADNSTFADLSGAAFTQVTTGAGTTEALSINLDACARYLRVVDAVGGTSPNTTRTVVLFARKQLL